jgi:hypothetical protein
VRRSPARLAFARTMTTRALLGHESLRNQDGVNTVANLNGSANPLSNNFHLINCDLLGGAHEVPLPALAYPSVLLAGLALASLMINRMVNLLNGLSHTVKTSFFRKPTHSWILSQGDETNIGIRNLANGITRAASKTGTETRFRARAPDGRSFPRREVGL